MKACIALLMAVAIAFSVEITRTLPAPSDNITGVAWAENLNVLYVIDGITAQVYGLNPETGAILTDWEMVGPLDYTPAGLTYYEDSAYVFGSFIYIDADTHIQWQHCGGGLRGSDTIDVARATGLTWNEVDLYASSTYSIFEGCCSYNYTGDSLAFSDTYIADYEAYPVGYDIAMDSDGNIWMATGSGVMPIQCYASPSGEMIQFISDTIGIGTEVRGLACEHRLEGDYLWASNITTDEIYQIYLNTTALTHSSWGQIKAASY